MTDHVDCIVIGAGVVGLAVARSLAMQGREVIILERSRNIGTGISSRNSEVIHAGIYYPKGSYKARFCAAGSRMLRQYAQARSIPYRITGKLIVATCSAEEEILAGVLQRGQENGVENLCLITGERACAEEPQLLCSAALLSSDTGIIDSYSYMLALLSDAEAHGAIIAYECPVVGGAIDDKIIMLEIGERETYRISTNSLVIAAGLSSCNIANLLGLTNVPRDRLCKGNYFSLSGKLPFSRLIYPVPVRAGLGIHYTLDMQNGARFGPDVEWIEAEEYSVSSDRRESFYSAIERYWPWVRTRTIEPAYSGIRPKVLVDDMISNDFIVGDAKLHGHKNVVALYGIESPGLTSSLAIAEWVAHELG